MDHLNKESSNVLSLSEIDGLKYSSQTTFNQMQEMEEVTIEDCVIMDVAFSSVATSSTRKSTLEATSTKVNDDNSTAPSMLLAVEEQEENVESRSDQALIATNVATTEVALAAGDNQAENAKRRISTHPQHKRAKGWIIRESPRPRNDRIDKFYVHILSNIQFRSLNEVDDFILLGFHPIRRTRRDKSCEVDTAKNGQEGTSKKRSGKRKLNWKFQIKGLLNDRITKVYDIKFFQQDPNYIHGSPTSSEGTISDFGSEDEEDEETIWRKNKEKVETFLKEAYENLLNSRVVASHENHHNSQ